MTAGSWNGLLRLLVGLHRRVRNETHSARAVPTVGDRALVSDDHGACVRRILPWIEFLRPGNSHNPAVPVERNSPSLTLRRKFKPDPAAPGEGVDMLLRVEIEHVKNLDTRGGAEIESPERGVDHVADPVADRTVTIGSPGAPVSGEVHPVIASLRGRSLPEVPVESIGNFRLLRTFRQLIDPGVHGAAGRVDRVDLADGAIPDPLDAFADIAE